MNFRRGLLFVIGLVALVAMIIWFMGQSAPPPMP
jgi:hypothetical protein